MHFKRVYIEVHEINFKQLHAKMAINNNKFSQIYYRPYICQSVLKYLYKPDLFLLVGQSCIYSCPVFMPQI